MLRLCPNLKYLDLSHTSISDFAMKGYTRTYIDMRHLRSSSYYVYLLKALFGKATEQSAIFSLQ